jgi:hypothetical protein
MAAALGRAAGLWNKEDKVDKEDKEDKEDKGGESAARGRCIVIEMPPVLVSLPHVQLCT